MPAGLPVSSLISVGINLSPPAAQAPTVNTMLIIGDSDVIDVKQRLRTYLTSAAVASDFGSNAPETLAAQLFFSQSPQPTSLYIGRWAKTATKGLLLGGSLSTAQQAMSNFTGIANGGFHVTADGGASTNVTGINLTGAANLNAVAALIQTALQALGGSFAAVTCVWMASSAQFLIKSGTTGASSSISVTTAPTAGTDLGPLILTNAATSTYAQPGIALESAISCVTLFDTQVTTPWYGLEFAAGTNNADIADSDHLAIAAYIEGSIATSGNGHLYGVTTNEAAALVSPDTTSIGAQLKAAGYSRTFVQWSNNPYAAISEIARILTVNPNGSLTAISLQYKQEPGVTPETFNSTQQAALNANNYNYYAGLNNGTAIIFNGMVANGQFIDTIWGCDALAGQIQTNVFNIEFQSTTKIPQTDAGANQLATGQVSALAQFVINGFLAPGTWTAGGFGQIKTGDFLDKGYYVYTPPIASQAPSARSARQSPAYQIAAKLAGAIHSANVQIFVNP